MSTFPGQEEEDFIHNNAKPDGLGEIFSEMISPDIAEMNEHAEELEAESEIGPDNI